jgi:hypothetical protein
VSTSPDTPDDVTVEDYEVLTFKALKRSHVWQYCLCNKSISADRRDAALMVESQLMRAQHFKFNPLVSAFDDMDEIRCGGSLRDLWCDYPNLVPRS